MPVVQLIPIRFKRHLLREQAGADGITIHLREDRRHITDRDLMLIQPNGSKTRLNLEMAVTEEMIEIACQTST